MAALEAALAGLTQRPELGRGGMVGADPDFWLLRELADRNPDADTVIFGGTLTQPEGQLAWQWDVPTADVRDQDWESAAAVLDALSHPVRLRLLQRVLNGTATTAELAADETLGTTGQLHHHLRALVAAGWLTSTGRGRWGIPPPRMIPLLIVIVAATTR